MENKCDLQTEFSYFILRTYRKGEGALEIPFPAVSSAAVFDPPAYTIYAPVKISDTGRSRSGHQDTSSDLASEKV